MASAAHCAYCFESLSASLEKRHPLSLPEVEDLWNEYNADDLDAEDEVDDDDESADDEEDEEMTDAEDMRATTTTLKPSPAISRLAADSPSSGSTNASTSSVQSATSSRSSAPTTASSATSKSTSSRTSFFSNLGRRVRGGHPSGSAPSAASASAEDAYPLFVTWNTLSRSGSKNLRGCIGTFEAQELSDGLRSYALTSAFEDTRFNQIASRELSSLECGVTLLTNFQPAADAMAWELGKHGLRISFTYHGRRYGSTYLPDVAKEQGWTKEETIVSLMRKAGWSGRRDDWRKVDLNVITYEGSKATLAYAEWKEWRDWVEQRAGVAVKALN